MIEWFFGLLSPSQWDAWRNWLATIGGVIALGIAALTYRRNVLLKREEQARLVYAEATQISRHEAGHPVSNTEFLPHDATLGAGGKSGPGIDKDGNPIQVLVAAELQVTVTVFNESKEIIGPVRIEIVDPMRGTFHRDPHLEFQSIRPGQSRIGEIRLDAEDEWSSAAPTIVFRDAGGEWWRRTVFEPVEHIHDDPANFAWNSPNRGPSARTTGKVWALNESVDVKLRLSTRWHRFWRARRGMSAIP